VRRVQRAGTPGMRTILRQRPPQPSLENEASLPWDGIERVEADGTVVFTAETVKLLLR
jgi:hypothetical protein